tara:strand:- start:13302 stop:14312 length:1011 start_codon:yes stop_codon:yes gene_type:complete
MTELINEYKKNELKIIRLNNEKNNIKKKISKKNKNGYIKKEHKKNIYNKKEILKEKNKKIEALKTEKSKKKRNYTISLSFLLNCFKSKSRAYKLYSFFKSNMWLAVFQFFVYFFYIGTILFISSPIFFLFLTVLFFVFDYFTSKKIGSYSILGGLKNLFIDSPYYITFYFFIYFGLGYSVIGAFEVTIFAIIKIFFIINILYKIFLSGEMFYEPKKKFKKIKKQCKLDLLNKIEQHKIKNIKINNKKDKAFLEKHNINIQSEMSWLLKNKKLLTEEILNDYDSFCYIYEHKKYSWNVDLKEEVEKNINIQKYRYYIGRETAIGLLEEELQYELQNN